MKQIIFLILLIFIFSLCGCSSAAQVQIVCTTLPVYTFTEQLCQGTGISVGKLISENVSCLHDYTLQPGQMKIIEQAELIVINGAGLEDFLEDALSSKRNIADASQGIHLAEGHHHDHDHETGHVHSKDPHIWLSPANAKIMSENICKQLKAIYPQHIGLFDQNLHQLNQEFDTLQRYAEEKLSELSCRELITFHDGFTYLAESFDLHILHAVEEESGSEASAAELIHLIKEVQEHHLSALFTEKNGSVSAAGIIAAETGVPIFTLDMAMAGDSYFESMYHNIDTLWEALK